ncbi:MAG: aminotransferase class I/II-fold pyridoxal phosphate-dependent enzyme [Deltaproteobacteria bacterium]|nr:aminotransferase class I/II-fold pyridoxal phosphate-dependent enzyme [Deltaproteobacteria bacterium]MBW2352865.1 aminotransferase class I/II-fold pyridoxal phosphate-dependent enzyme [Deltaproteobacteria bacterium]HDZ90577.1 aminotransferase class I/II-fold pyridoxal phosphate-dependent enzyme [Deltaproteobacteria bacterium]
MNPIAQELNQIIRSGNEHIYEMLSEVGKNLFFPKGILSQSAEAREKAHRFNATIGMATEKGRTMHLPSVMAMLGEIRPEDALTYAPSFGILPLRETWQDELYRKNSSLKGKEVSLPVVTNAITHGLSVVSDMWVDPGDTIVLPDKMWGNYNLIFAVRRGARIVNYPLFDHKGRFNLEEFQSCVSTHAGAGRKIIPILNFPNNPTGYTVTSQEADGIAEILTDAARGGTMVLALTDDAYFGLFYDEEAMKESIFTRLMGKDPRLLAVKLDGATKENFVWGLRVGFITYGASLTGESRPVYEALEKKTAGAVRGSISNASHLSQEIVLRSLRSEGFLREKDEKFRIMQARAREVKRVLSDPRYKDAWEPYPFNSGYFMCLRLKTVEAEPLRVHLLDRYGIGLISLGKADLRVAFSCLEEGDTRELFDTLLQAVKDLEA